MLVTAASIGHSTDRMTKKNWTKQEGAATFGVGKLTRHLFICLGPDCTDLDRGEATWEYLKKRLKELNLAGPDGPFYRTKWQCLRICNGGPHCGEDIEGTWCRHLTPANTHR